ncbi:MAG: 50S ribosomal protein L9 [Gammaproteobacteria bacterium]|tara:strand:- start:20 stop:466 length:447 start_codon:yes stop_codon:yes gene_type:complete
MKVILKETVTGLGSPGDLVDVKSGYGRNFLLPGGKAIPATDENLKVYEAEKSKLLEAEKQKISLAKELLEKLNDFNLSISVAVTDEGVMYGSIGTKEISDGLEVNGFAIERQSIRLPEGALKELGEFKIDIELHAEVIASINLSIKSE